MAKYALTATSYCLDCFHSDQIGEKLNSFGSLNKIPISKDNYQVLLDHFHQWTNWWKAQKYLKLDFFNSTTQTETGKGTHQDNFNNSHLVHSLSEGGYLVFLWDFQINGVTMLIYLHACSFVCLCLFFSACFMRIANKKLGSLFKCPYIMF
jgi:hypothetical protein